MQGFLKPHLKGERFQGGGIPLDVLADISALGEMVIEVAKLCYLEQHPDRKRSPKRFTASFSLNLAGVEKASAIPVIDLETVSAERADSPQFPGMPGEYESYVVAARDRIIGAIDAAAKDELSLDLLPAKYLGLFDRVGRRLHEGESIEFFGAGLNGNAGAQLTRESRRRLVLAAHFNGVTEEVTVRGTIPETDQGRLSFELQLPSGRRIDVDIYPQQHVEAVLEVFNDYQQGGKVLIRGLGRLNKNFRLERIESIDEIVPLDPLDVPFRLLELKELTDGWFDGEGTAPTADFLDWLGKRFGHPAFEDLPLPHIYPTLNGGVQAEWSLDALECGLKIDPASRVGDWHVLNTDTDEEEEDTFLVDEDNALGRLAAKIRSLL